MWAKGQYEGMLADSFAFDKDNNYVVKLKDGVTAGSEMPVREALGIRHSVQIVPNRKDG